MRWIFLWIHGGEGGGKVFRGGGGGGCEFLLRVICGFMVVEVGDCSRW